MDKTSGISRALLGQIVPANQENSSKNTFSDLVQTVARDAIQNSQTRNKKEVDQDLIGERKTKKIVKFRKVLDIPDEEPTAKVKKSKKTKNKQSDIPEDDKEKKIAKEEIVLDFILDDQENIILKSNNKDFVQLHLDVAQGHHIKAGANKSSISYLSQNLHEYATILKIIALEEKCLWFFGKKEKSLSDDLQKKLDGKSIVQIVQMLKKSNMLDTQLSKMNCPGVDKSTFEEIWKKVLCEIKDIEKRKESGSLEEKNTLNTNADTIAKKVKDYFKRLFVDTGFEMDLYYVSDKENFGVHYYPSEGGKKK